ncbi:MAG TPA: Gfo/Idh/MocA family oxidoreductase [Verrucomicrobiae bacterium]|nr:Gfo/Idh/MocA family oxidoreductase [Verrucomicrobiae bacterium]
MNDQISRRQFVKTSTLALGATVALSRAQVSPGETLRIGLVGCGGRGTGAAADALHSDANIKLVAVGDVFADRLKSSLQTLSKQDIAKKIDVPEKHQFIGFDAYQKVIAESDVVLLATPPHFRPIHMQAAIDAGKHVFAEKPVAVDAPGVRKVLATCEAAKKKNLSIVSGLAIRYSYAHREIVKRIHEGALGKIRTLQANDFRGPIWVKPRQPDWTDMEYHMRNWYYFTWLSGDFNVEQHIHMLDLCSWVMKDEYPVRAYGTGGRQVRTAPEYGNIYDHHSVTYEYENGQKLFAACRQMAGCSNDISVHVAGAKGIATLDRRIMQIDTGEKWRYTGEKNNQSQTEHEELFASIRSGKPINNGEYMTKSTLLAIMGRMATYTGQTITWDQAMNSQEDLSPSGYTWDAKPPESPIPIPGVTRFV